MKLLTFLDSGVLIAAARAEDTTGIKAKAYAILNDPDRVFAASALIRQETLPKAIFNKRDEEAEFYKEYFGSLEPGHYLPSVDPLLEEAFDEAQAAGVGPWDALHVVAAVRLGATELVTSEGSEKSIFRARRIKVTTIKPAKPPPAVPAP